MKEIMKNEIRSLDQKQKKEKTLNKSLDSKHQITLHKRIT